MLFDSNQYALLESTYKDRYKKFIKVGMQKLKNYHKGEALKRAKCLTDRDFKEIEDPTSHRQSSEFSSSLTDSSRSSKGVKSGKSMDRLDVLNTNKERLRKESIQSKNTNKSSFLAPSFRRNRLGSFCGSFIEKSPRSHSSSSRHQSLHK